MAYLTIQSDEFKTFKRTIKPLLEADLQKYGSAEALVKHVERCTNKTLSDKYIDTLMFNQLSDSPKKVGKDRCQTSKLDILCQYFGYQDLEKLLQQQYIRPNNYSLEDKVTVIVRITEQLTYFRKYDFDNNEIFEICQNMYDSTLLLCEQATLLGMSFYPEVTELKSILVVIASDRFSFTEATTLKEGLLPALCQVYGRASKEYQGKKYKLDIYTLNSFNSNEKLYQEAQIIHGNDQPALLYALNRRGFAYVSEGKFIQASQIFNQCEAQLSQIIYTTPQEKEYQEAYILLYKGYFHYKNEQPAFATSYLEKARGKFIQCFHNKHYYVGIIAYLLWKIKGSSAYLEQTKDILLGRYPSRRFWIFETKPSIGEDFGYYEGNDNKTTLIYNELENA